MKKILLFILCLTITVCTLPVTANAARDVSYEEALAQDLKNLGLFQGVSENDFDLDREPTRIEALVMLIRLLGQENAAKEGEWLHPFKDVPQWADGYVGYAYQQGLTKGISDTEFGTDNANARMYITFVLRALGYSDTNGEDFVWNNPYILAEDVNILPDSVDRNNFWRADVVLVSYAALNVHLKGSTKTLAQKMIAENAFTYEQYLTYYNVDALSKHFETSKILNAEEIYKKCSPAVFYIEIYDKNGNATSSGSGFFIDENGTAVTNYHVIDTAFSAKIIIPYTKETYDVSGVYDYDAANDWAVIKVSGNGFSHLEIADSSTVTGGASVYAIGSPLGLQNSISEGLISNTNREIDGTTYIQTSAAISHGSSGGALINKYGEVIGITSAGITEGENLGFAIPITAIYGYDNSSVTPLSNKNITSDKEDTSDRKTEAQALLNNFVRMYANETISDSVAYTERRNTQYGYVEGSIVLNSDGTVTCLVWEVYDGDTYYVEFDLEITDDICYVYYSYNLDEPYNFRGESYMNASEINENYDFHFDNYEGNASRTTNEEICKEQILTGLDFVNFVFEILTEEYNANLYSVYDLGFTSF